jgi:hypothetical protein
MRTDYGGRNVSHHRNIVWSNGALDPWSGQGVYPPGGGSDGPMVQPINADGSQIAVRDRSIELGTCVSASAPQLSRLLTIRVASACGDPACGDPACGDPACGDPACGDPACGDPACGDPACLEQLLLDLGAHHLDLMFSDPRNPPCFKQARAIEERMIRQFIQEAYDAHTPSHAKPASE